jgi:LSD1 subclass zinc finger protein
MSDNFTNINCESCGADLALPKGESSIKCGFCSTLNKPSQDDLKPKNKSRILLLNAVESENWDDVKKYTTTILEEDPSDYEAWFFKGAAAGWSSTHAEDPSKEITNCYRNAFANSTDDNLEEAIELIATKGTELLDALAIGSRGFAQDHGYTNVGSIAHDGWEADVMNRHINKTYGFITAAYTLTEINRNDRVQKLNPHIDAFFIYMVSILYTSHGFEGVFSKKNPFAISDVTYQHNYDPTSELGLKWESRVDEILEIYKSGGYEADLIEKYDLSEQSFSDPRSGNAQVAEEGGCFIATAVYGSENHFNLIVLRSFRDNFLQDYSFGRKFINFYYKKGPQFAKKIKNSFLLTNLFKPLVNLGVQIVKIFKLG